MSLRFALAGVLYVLRSERNVKIEATIGVLVLGAGLFFRISAVEWAVLCVCISLVLALETLNTALEAVVDLAMPEQHDLARLAKDAAAGAVLVVVLGSIGVGIAIFLPRIWRLLTLCCV